MNKLFLITLVSLVLSQQYSASTLNQGVVTAVQSTRQTYVCAPGFYWTTQSCQPCQFVTNGYCSCTSLGGCTANSITCNSGYALVSNTCQPIPTGCLTYGFTSANDALICYTCISGYTLLGGICILTQSCTTYTTTNAQCTACAAGYFLNWQLQTTQTSANGLTGSKLYTSLFQNFQGFCSPCMTACSSCSSPQTCSQCNTGYFWQQATATQLTSNTPASTLGLCAQCPIVGCNACTSSTTCTGCYSSYYLIPANGTTQPSCGACSSNCITCTSSTVCTACQTGSGQSNFLAYALVSNACVACPANCTSCTAVNTCTACNSAYPLWDTVAFTCNAYPANCQLGAFLSGTSGTITCKTCQDTYFMSVAPTATTASQCSPCTAGNAIRCAGPNDSGTPTTANATAVPTQCVGGYYLISIPNGSTNTVSCVSQATTVTCLTITNTTTSTGSTCASCITNYTLYTSSNTCQACPVNCTCTTGTTGPNCTSCTGAYYFTAAATGQTTGTCSPCASGCATCTSGQNCTVVISGYYLVSAAPQPCGTSCSVCTSNTVCTTCFNGYFPSTTTSGTTNTTICLACQSNCATCSAPGSSCLTCYSGYILQNGGCVLLNYANCIGSLATQSTTTQQLTLANGVASTGCTSCQYGFYLNQNQCLQCLNPYAGYVCRANQAAPTNNGNNTNTNGTSPTVQYAIINAVGLVLLALTQ